MKITVISLDTPERPKPKRHRNRRPPLIRDIYPSHMLINRQREET
ncbi:MAG TPA: hypothetical protein VHD60_00680 [Candidatus Saccharimonadales bacterium]|nr:hypothetical protein [Candidatus Saccharimonadales bacterium]